METKLKGVEHEISQLKREIEELCAGFMTQKKYMEELQTRFIVQKNELEARFAAQNKELEEEYQKQVDEMYFFGYYCCMKKNDIMHDIPSFPSNDDDEILGGSS